MEQEQRSVPLVGPAHETLQAPLSVPFPSAGWCGRAQWPKKGPCHGMEGSRGASAAAWRSAVSWPDTRVWNFAWTRSECLEYLSQDTVHSEWACLANLGVMPGMLGETVEFSEGAKNFGLCLILIIYMSCCIYWPVNFKDQFKSW